MDIQQFKEWGRATIDLLADYHDSIRKRPVMPLVSPGYLSPLIPGSIPEQSEPWQDILEDVERVVMPGMTHWQAPSFFGFYPAGASFPSVVGEMMSAGLGVVCSSWENSPACTELELIVMDWLAKAMDLPEDLLNCANSEGGGCLQGSACEATLLALLAAKEKTVRRVSREQPQLSEQQIKSRLVCYSSTQSNSSVEKASLLASVTIRLLEPDEDGSLRGDTLENAMEEDTRSGLIPCYVVGTLGTTATSAMDRMDELGAVCRRRGAWLHCDAAYAGVARICPELRPQVDGLLHADSLVTNLHKWLLVNFDCSAMWFKSCKDIEETLSVDRARNKRDQTIPDLRDWQIPTSRRFRALKVWFTLRSFGISGLRSHIREHVRLAALFEQLLLADPRFELAAPTRLGLVCFRFEGDNCLSMELLEELNARRKVYMTPGKIFNTVFIRFVLCSPNTTEEDVRNCVLEILKTADSIIGANLEHGKSTMDSIKPKFTSDQRDVKGENINSNGACVDSSGNIKIIVSHNLRQGDDLGPDFVGGHGDAPQKYKCDSCTTDNVERNIN